MRRDKERLLDILEAIEKIESRMVETRIDFDTDEMLQVWIIHYLQIIGEAISQLNDKLKNQYPSVPWRAIVGLRNILVHQYFDFDSNIIWNVVGKDLTTLKNSVEIIIGEISEI